MSEVVIRQVTPDEADALRTLRLESLQVDPDAFYSSHEEESPRPLSFTRDRLAAQQGDSFTLAAVHEGRFVGMVGFVREERPKGAHKGFIWGMYVQPAFRGTGLGRRLLDAVLDRVRGQPGLRLVHLSVVTTNTAALVLYERAGFEIYGTERCGMVVDGRDLDEHLMVWWVPASTSARTQARTGSTR